ncbi:hypothetical protein ACHAWF_001223 [Thalassiosira exigua]
MTMTPLLPRLRPLLPLLLLSLVGIASAVVLYDDGLSHSISAAFDDAISLRSSSTLTLPRGEYAVRAPPGSDAAIRLSMGSRLDAEGGDVMGADASGEGARAGAGIVVGGGSRATFREGATVRGGSRSGAAGDVRVSTGAYETADGDGDDEGRGGDAVVARYYGSNVTILGGTFVAGKGAGDAKDGRSLRADYEASIRVEGGTFYGSWIARGEGVIVASGCVSRIGTRLVGRLADGRALDVQTVEENGGKVVVERRPEVCNRYKYDKGGESSAGASELRRFPMWPWCLAAAVISICYYFG